MSHVKYKFVDNILALSETDDINQLSSEWRPIYTEISDDQDIICICGRCIKNAIYCYNSITKHCIAVGSGCIKKFDFLNGALKSAKGIFQLRSSSDAKMYINIDDLEAYSREIKEHIIELISENTDLYTEEQINTLYTIIESSLNDSDLIEQLLERKKYFEDIRIKEEQQRQLEELKAEEQREQQRQLAEFLRKREEENERRRIAWRKQQIENEPFCMIIGEEYDKLQEDIQIKKLAEQEQKLKEAEQERHNQKSEEAEQEKRQAQKTEEAEQLLELIQKAKQKELDNKPKQKYVEEQKGNSQIVNTWKKTYTKLFRATIR